MSHSFQISLSADDDVKKLRRLMDVWEGLYVAYKEEKDKSCHVFKIEGDKSGLEVVKKNIEKAVWKTELRISDILPHGHAPQALSPKIVVYIPCIEAVAESGRVTLPKELPTVLRKRLRTVAGKSLDGWRIVYSKASVGLAFNTATDADQKKLISAIDRGWSKWKVCHAARFSTVEPDEVIPPDEASEQYTEIRALVGEAIVENLEGVEGVKFKSNKTDKPPPDDLAIYDCAARFEDPWRITWVADGKETVLYDADKKLLNEKGIKAAILKKLR